MEVGQFGDPVLADVVASGVGQQGDALSRRSHLKETTQNQWRLGSELGREASKTCSVLKCAEIVVDATPCQTGRRGRLRGSWCAPAAPGSCLIWCLGPDEAGCWQRRTGSPGGPPRPGAESGPATASLIPGEGRKMVVTTCRQQRSVNITAHASETQHSHVQLVTYGL